MNDDNSIPSDSELLSAIQTGDEPTQRGAIDKLINKYGERLNHVIVKYLLRKNCKQSRVHAEGVCSFVWIKTLGGLGTLRDRAKFDRWLLRTARNEANRHLRLCILNEKRDGEFPDESHLPPARLTNYYQSRDAAIDMDRMLSYAESISEIVGSIFRLRYEQELDFDEIGRRLGKSTANIRNLHYRALRKIKAKFNAEGAEHNREETDARDEDRNKQNTSLRKEIGEPYSKQSTVDDEIRLEKEKNHEQMHRRMA